MLSSTFRLHTSESSHAELFESKQHHCLILCFHTFESTWFKAIYFSSIIFHRHKTTICYASIFPVKIERWKQKSLICIRIFQHLWSFRFHLSIYDVTVLTQLLSFQTDQGNCIKMYSLRGDCKRVLTAAIFNITWNPHNNNQAC